MEIKNIKKNIEKALEDKDLNLSYVRVDKGAMDEGDERATYYTSIGTEPALEPREIEKAIEKIMPSEHCQHDFDCCGGWYQGSFNVVDRFSWIPNSGSYLVTVSWNKNI
tara:strand:+ start:447 stop:773 length:327 start_codon:yes stop_codon:yes gene_type:complete